MTKLLQNLALAVITTVFCFFLGEAYFRYFYTASDGMGVTLAHAKWQKKYWHPVNSNGLRDREWAKKDLSGKKIIQIIGDSLPAGHGIKNASDRFPDLLAKKLGDKYAVINFSFPGWGTKTELFVLKNYPLKPDVVIWSYFPNDISDAAKEHGNISPNKTNLPNGITRKIISSSYFLNYIYWNLFRIINLNNNYFTWVQNQFNDPAVWNTHKRELELVCEITKDKKAKLVVVLFPFLTKKANSSKIITRVKSVFKSNNVPVLDISELVSDLSEKELVVSKIDAHPSIKVHKLVSEDLYKVVLNLNKDQL